MTEKKGRGRPKGAVETPRTALRQDLKDQIKLNKRMRELILRQLEKIERALEALPEEDIGHRLELVTALTESLAGQAKGVEATAKHVLSGEEKEGGGDEFNLDELLRRG